MTQSRWEGEQVILAICRIALIEKLSMFFIFFFFSSQLVAADAAAASYERQRTYLWLVLILSCCSKGRQRERGIEGGVIREYM